MYRPCLALTVSLVLACQPDILPPPAADLAVTHVAVVDVAAGEIHPDQTVLVLADRIVAVGPAATTPVSGEAVVVDATGLFAIPGLWDAHVHSATRREWHFPMLVSYGVTSVRNMHASVDTALELTRAIKREISDAMAEGRVVGPRFLAGGPILDGSPAAWPGSISIQAPADGRAAVDSLDEGGADFVKIYDDLGRDAFLAIADEARTRGIPLDGHIPFQVTPQEAAAEGQRTMEHDTAMLLGCSARADSLRREHQLLLERLPTVDPHEGVLGFLRLVRALSDTRDPALCQATASALAEAGVAVVPTLAVAMADAQTIAGDSARMRLLPTSVRQEWATMAGPDPGAAIAAIMNPVVATALENLRVLHAAGVTLLAGTDVGNPFVIPGISLHDELGHLVDAGLSPLEALRAATVDPARVFGLADSLGAVERGKLADFVLLEGDPLEDIANTRKIGGVVLGGIYLDPAALAERRAGQGD